MTITEVYGNAPPDAFICAIAAHIAELIKKEKEGKDHEYLGASGDRPQMARKAHPAAACESC